VIKTVSRAFSIFPKTALFIIAYLFQLAFFQTLMASNKAESNTISYFFTSFPNSKDQHCPTKADYRMLLKHEDSNKQSPVVHLPIALHPGLSDCLTVVKSPKPELKFQELSPCLSDDAYQRYRLLRVFLI